VKIPGFKNEKDEAEFWDTHDTTDYIDDTIEVENIVLDESVLPQKKKAVTFRIEEKYINQLKNIAQKKAIGYQTLMRMFIVEKLNEFLKTNRKA